MVNIKISVRSAYPASDPRNQRLRHYFEAAQYEIHNGRQGWQAERHDSEGSDVKQALRAAGFADNDFKIRVEYQRAWGFL